MRVDLPVPVLPTIYMWASAILFSDSKTFLCSPRKSVSAKYEICFSSLSINYYGNTIAARGKEG